MRIAYPLLWSSLGRGADREQSVNTAAALARLGVKLTLLMPRRGHDAALDADTVRSYFNVTGDFALVQRACAWAGERVLGSFIWLRRLFQDPEVTGSDLIYSRAPLMLAIGGTAPVPFATDHYRPWPDQWPMLRPLIRRTAQHRRCLGFVLHSEYAAESYRRLPVADEKLLVAHNGADLGRMLPRLDKRQARTLLDLPPDRPIAVYAGRMNGKKGLDQVLALADRRPETLFLLVGSEGQGRIEQAAAARANVRVYPWQTPERLPPFLYAADVLVIPPSRAPLERFGNCVLPLKTFGYLAAGRPILAPESPDTAELLRHETNALLVPPDEPDTAAAALVRLLKEPNFADRLGTNAQRLADTLTWDHRARRIATFLESNLRFPGWNSDDAYETA